VQDVSVEKNYLSCSPKVKAEIVAPIFKEGRVVGELDINFHELALFNEEDEKFLNNDYASLSVFFRSGNLEV
jgi:L-methionine (R)-S-oxide reductase